MKANFRFPQSKTFINKFESINVKKEESVYSLTLPMRSTSRSEGDPYNSNHMYEPAGLKLPMIKRSVYCSNTNISM